MRPFWPGLFALAALCIRGKTRQKWNRVPFPPTPPHFHQNFFAVRRHFLYDGIRGAGFLVSRPPNQQIQNHGRQIDSLLRQPVIHFSSVALFRFRRDDPRRGELVQAVRQNVRRDFLVRFLKLFERVESAHHHVANDQQRPAISQRFERDAQWTPGPLLRLRLSFHSPHSSKCNLHNASDILPCTAPCKTAAVSFFGKAMRRDKKTPVLMCARTGVSCRGKLQGTTWSRSDRRFRPKSAPHFASRRLTGSRNTRTAAAERYCRCSISRCPIRRQNYMRTGWLRRRPLTDAPRQKAPDQMA